MANKQFTVVVVRHGEATHNLDTFSAKDMVRTIDGDTEYMDSPLTDLGRHQADLVSKRLANTCFHLCFSSDMIRAWDTAQTILANNNSLELLVEPCKLLRERNAGIFEGERELDRAQCLVEAAVKDRELLTWRIPGGESISDLRDRVRKFLNLLLKMVLTLEEDRPRVLVVTHRVWMEELHRILQEHQVEPTRMPDKPLTPNTGVDTYIMDTVQGTVEGQPNIQKIQCVTLSCGRHL